MGRQVRSGGRAGCAEWGPSWLMHLSSPTSRGEAAAWGAGMAGAQWRVVPAALCKLPSEALGFCCKPRFWFLHLPSTPIQVPWIWKAIKTAQHLRDGICQILQVTSSVSAMISHGNKRFEPRCSSSRLGSELAAAEPGLSSASSTFRGVSKTCLEGKAEVGVPLRLYLSLKILLENSVPGVTLAHWLQRDARKPLEVPPVQAADPTPPVAAPPWPQRGRGGSAENRPGPECRQARAFTVGGVEQSLHSKCRQANFYSSSLTSLWAEFSILTAQQNHLETLKNL